MFFWPWASSAVKQSGWLHLWFSNHAPGTMRDALGDKRGKAETGRWGLGLPSLPDTEWNCSGCLLCTLMFMKGHQCQGQWGPPCCQIQWSLLGLWLIELFCRTGISVPSSSTKPPFLGFLLSLSYSSVSSAKAPSIPALNLSPWTSLFCLTPYCLI